MSIRFRARLIAPSILVLASAMSVAAQQEPVVETISGPVRGEISQYNDEVFVFRGIPYAADTGGENRFMPPQPVEPWTEVRDATEYGNRCPQGDFPPPPMMQEEGEDLDKGPMSEDCLFLNVWTAGLDDGGLRPVMVWHHGGGLNSGSGGSIRYDGTNLASRQDVVLVTTNHRLNVFGYTNLSEINEDYAGVANVGLLDIVQSLEWVRDNIERFGGDPDNVTVIGESGGGRKNSYLLGMPAAEGLFHRSIHQSGFDLAAAATAEARTGAARTMLERLGVGDDLEGLADKSWEEILEAGGGAGNAWVDGTVLPRNSYAPDANPLSTDIPMIVGWTLTERTFHDGPLGPITDEELVERVSAVADWDDATVTQLIETYRESYPDFENNVLFLALQGDYAFGANHITAARRNAAQEGAAPAFLYHFRQPTEVRDLMVPHSVDIAYVFDNLELSTRTNGEVTPEKQELASIVSEAFANFARNGVPTAEGLPEWRPFTLDDPAMLVIEPDLRMEPLPEAVALTTDLRNGTN